MFFNVACSANKFTIINQRPALYIVKVSNYKNKR